MHSRVSRIGVAPDANAMLKSTLYLLIAAAAIALIVSGAGSGSLKNPVLAPAPQTLVTASATLPVAAPLPPAALSQEPRAFPPGATETNASSFLRLTLDFGDGTVRTFEPVHFTPGQTLFEVMKTKLAKEHVAFEYRTYSGLGEFVTAIGSKKNSGGNYWQFWANSAYATVGAGMYQPKDGDIIEWKFIKQQPIQ